MKPPPFVYARPETLDEALHLLDENGDDGKVLAGGQSLIPLLAFRMARPVHLTDVTRVPNLDYVHLEESNLSIGALATHRALETNTQLKTRCAAISEAVSQIGHVAIRNRGTVGGSMAHADPAAEWPTLALLFDAELTIQNVEGSRTISAEEMFLGYMTTALLPNELLTSIDMRLPPPTSGTAFVEVSRRHGDFALAGAGAVLEIEGGVISAARISVMSVGLTAIRGAEAEQLLIGNRATDEVLKTAAESIEGAVEPLEDVHGPVDYKVHLAKVVVMRALTSARTRSTESVA